MKISMIAGYVLAASIGFSAPAYAISDEAECKALVASTTRDLLKATVTNEQLSEIDGKLAVAGGMCSSGDFAGAETLINEAAASLAAVAK